MTDTNHEVAAEIAARVSPVFAGGGSAFTELCSAILAGIREAERRAAAARIDYTCPECTRRYRLPAAVVGWRVGCKTCGAVSTVPFIE